MQIFKHHAHTWFLANSRPKRFAESAQDIAHYVTEELHQMQQKNEVGKLGLVIVLESPC